MASPNPRSRGIGDGLSGLAAVSSRDAWAVGYSDGRNRTLVLHWNGTTKTVRIPYPGDRDALSAVAASSATCIWAVGGGYETRL